MYNQGYLNSCHGGCQTIYECDCSVLDCLADKVKMDVYMLHPGMKVVVEGQGDGHLVVTVQYGGIRERSRELPQECMKPCSLLGHVCHSYILSFSHGQC